MNTDAPTAVVTGASRGLGYALADALAGAGYRLVIDARDDVALQAAAASLASRHGWRVTPVPGDIADPGHRAALAAAAGEFGGASLLINNAGTLGLSPLPALADYPAADLLAAFATNVVAPIALTQLLLPGLRQSGGA